MDTPISTKWTGERVSFHCGFRPPLDSDNFPSPGTSFLEEFSAFGFFFVAFFMTHSTCVFATRFFTDTL